jgi:hypothetical protein
MPGKTPEPWYRESKRAWFVCINGKQHRLGKHKEEAHRRFHLLMAGGTPTATHGKAGQKSGENGGERHGASTAKLTAPLTVDGLATAYLTEAGRRLSATPCRVASWMVRTFTTPTRARRLLGAADVQSNPRHAYRLRKPRRRTVGYQGR